MDIEKAKALCAEHDKLKTTVKIINEATKKHWWMVIKSPEDESYLSNVQIRAILDLATSRMKEIEDLIK